MKTFFQWAFSLSCIIVIFQFAAQAADTNPPPRLTIELRDGSRVVGTSMEKNFKFQSSLFGELKLMIKDVHTIESLSTNGVKLTTANGDVLFAQFAESSLDVKTSFGKVELPVASIQKLSVSTGGLYILHHEGLIGFWSGNGNADDSVGGDNGILMGGVNFAPGISGQAFNFEAPGDFVKISRTPALDLTNQITIEFWMKPDAANLMNDYQGLVTSDFYGVEISNGWGGTMGVNFFLNATIAQPMRFGSGRMLQNSGVTTVANFTHIADANGGGALVSAGQWHHVAATYDGVQMRLYIDGQMWGHPVSHRGAILPTLPGSFISIGSEDGRTTCPDCVANRYFKGMISTVAIYNRALSPSEIHEDFEMENAN